MTVHHVLTTPAEGWFLSHPKTSITNCHLRASPPHLFLLETIQWRFRLTGPPTNAPSYGLSENMGSCDTDRKWPNDLWVAWKGAGRHIHLWESAEARQKVGKAPFQFHFFKGYFLLKLNRNCKRRRHKF